MYTTQTTQVITIRTQMSCEEPHTSAEFDTYDTKSAHLKWMYWGVECVQHLHEHPHHRREALREGNEEQPSVVSEEVSA